MKLTFYITNQSIQCHIPSTMVSDTVNYLSAEFVFKDDAWTNLSKYAHFMQGESVYDIPIVNNEISESAGLNLSAGDWTVYLHGDRFENGNLVKRITTTQYSFHVQKSGCLEGEIFPSIKSDLTTQLLARMDELEKNGGSSGTISKEEIVDAVEDYMENYPIEDGTNGVGISKISIMEVKNGE